MRFLTQSGSIYLVDDGTKSFWRTKTTDISGHIRGGDGPHRFNTRTEIKIGEGVHFFCDPINPKADVRDVYTSDVTEIL
jgi:hypothetical protein